MPQRALTKIRPELARSHTEASTGIDLGHVSACRLSRWCRRLRFSLSLQGVPMIPLSFTSKNVRRSELGKFRCH